MNNYPPELHYLNHSINILKKTDLIYSEFLKIKPLMHSSYRNTQLRCYLVITIKSELPACCISIRIRCDENKDPIPILEEFLNRVYPSKQYIIDKIIEVPVYDFIEAKAFLIRQAAMCAHIHLIDENVKEPDMQNLGADVYVLREKNFILLNEDFGPSPYDFLLHDDPSAEKH